MNEHPHQICVPGVYGMEDLAHGTTLPQAKKRLQPYIGRDLRCCVMFDDHALYLEPNGTTVKGPLPYGGVWVPLKDERV